MIPLIFILVYFGIGLSLAVLAAYFDDDEDDPAPYPVFIFAWPVVLIILVFVAPIEWAKQRGKKRREHKAELEKLRQEMEEKANATL